MNGEVTRRTFLTASAAASATAITARAYGRLLGANERLGVGLIGFGLIGKRHLLDFQQQPDAEVRGVAEVHRGRLDEALALAGESARGYGDFRRLLDRSDVDAVVVATPDHWHALQTMLACAAGKDVYVEKPLSLFVREGQWMLDVARRHRRVVQVGTQQRSGAHYQRARQLIREGYLGRVVSVELGSWRNILPGYGSPADGEPPAELDYDLWLGPAPERPYNPNRVIYHFRWYWDYSGGQMTNLGQHSLDIVDWTLDTSTLALVASTGGRFALEDNGETPDVQDSLFAFDGWTARWSHRECARGETRPYGLVFHGTRGSLGISRAGFSVLADPEIPPELTVPHFAGAHPVGGPVARAPLGPHPPRTRPLEDRSGDGRAQFRDHKRNFLDCVKSRREPVSDLASGHRVATLCHLANLSLQLGRALRWNPATASVADDPQANALLERPYRAPWDRELRALLA